MKYTFNQNLLIAILVSAMAIFSCSGNNANPAVLGKDPDGKQPTFLAEATVSPAAGLFIDDGGNGRIPVVFVHSFGGSCKHWQAQLIQLRKNRRAIAFDLRGHGRSRLPADSDYTVYGFETDIQTVADSLHLDKFVLVGHSLGGAAAIAYAAKHPDRVAGLVLEGTPGKATPEQIKGVISSLELDKYDAVMAAYMNKLLTNARPVTDSIERDGMKRLPKQVSLRIIKAIFDFDPVPSLQKYPGRVLIINTPEENQPGALQTYFPKFQHEVVEGTSHWIHMDKPDKFNELLDAFLLKTGK